MKRNPGLRQVAPHMGSLADGIEKFLRPKAYYPRGGGIPATEVLELACVEHCWGWDPKGKEDPPYITVTANGHAANHIVGKALRDAGNIVVGKHLFGTTKYDLIRSVQREGAKLMWVDPCDTNAFVQKTREDGNVIAWFVEAASNPAGRVPDFTTLRQAATDYKVLLIVDATLAVGMPAFKGKDWADIMTVSLTKQAGNGRNENMGGAIIVRNNIPTTESAVRFPEYIEHLLDANGKLPRMDNPFGVLTTKLGMSITGGASIVPRVALSIAKGLPHMQDRVAQYCENARAVAELLCNDSRVQSVQLAGYSTDKANDERALHYLGGNHWVVMATLKGGLEVADKFLQPEEFSHSVALGQATTALSHSSTSTHRAYTEPGRNELGIYLSTLRISVGAEPTEKLLKRMKRVLASLNT